MAESATSSKLLLVAAASAAAGSLLTLVSYKLYAGAQAGHRRQEPEEANVSPAAARAASNGELKAAAARDAYDPSPRVG